MDFGLHEYQALRGEITARAKMAHQILNIASVLVFLSVAGGFVANWFGQLQSFLLFLPIVFALLTFNYQTNQWTLFTLAAYLRDHSSVKNNAGPWESYVIAKRAENHHLLSFLALLPLLAPLLLPFIVWWWFGASASTLDVALTSTDLLVLALVIFNFRYQIGR